MDTKDLDKKIIKRTVLANKNVVILILLKKKFITLGTNNFSNGDSSKG